MASVQHPPPGPESNTIEWASLRFSPLGLVNLRRNLIQSINPSIISQYRSRFEAAEIAWYSAGLASSASPIGPHEFHPELYALRDATAKDKVGTAERKTLREKALAVTFDCAALLDRHFGSATLVIHIPGTTRPRSLHREDYVKANVYFPAHLLREERYSKAIDDIVQRYIKDVGLPNIARYEHCASLHWKLGEVNGHTQEPYSQHGIQPKAVSFGASVFEYHGRLAKAPVVVIDDDDDDEEKRSLLKSASAGVIQKRIHETPHSLMVARRRGKDALADIERLNGMSLSSNPQDSNSKQTSHNYSSPSSSVSTTVATTSASRPAGLGVVDSPRRSDGLGPSKIGTHPNNSSTATVIDSPYVQFVKSNKLQDKYFYIEHIRTGIAVYLWRAHLIEAGISVDVVDDLMALMSRHSPTNN